MAVDGSAAASFVFCVAVLTTVGFYLLQTRTGAAAIACSLRAKPEKSSPQIFVGIDYSFFIWIA